MIQTIAKQETIRKNKHICWDPWLSNSNLIYNFRNYEFKPKIVFYFCVYYLSLLQNLVCNTLYQVIIYIDSFFKWQFYNFYQIDFFGMNRSVWFIEAWYINLTTLNYFKNVCWTLLMLEFVKIVFFHKSIYIYNSRSLLFRARFLSCNLGKQNLYVKNFIKISIRGTCSMKFKKIYNNWV